MGLFGKKRHGTLISTSPEHRNFQWTIPHISTCPAGTVLDSDNIKSAFGVKFHFHLSVSETHIGFYIHYKKAPIPKFSYVFASTSGAELRQQTAHYIPPEAEKCGHWSVGSISEIKELVKGAQDDTLVVYFSYDSDKVTSEERGDDLSATWKIPNFLTTRVTPLTGPLIETRSIIVIPRIDKKRSGQYQVFLFSRTADIPPHAIRIVGKDGEVIASVEEREQVGAVILSIQQDVVEKALVDGTLHISIIVFNQSNPIKKVFGNAVSPPPGKDTGGNSETPGKTSGYAQINQE